MADTPWIDDRSLGPAAARGTVVVTIFRVVGTFVSLGTTAILARILVPSDFGIIDLAGTLTALLAVTGDLGLSLATVQSEEIDDRQVSNLWWLSSAFGLLLWILSALSGPLLVILYNEPALYWVAGTLGLNFFLGGMAAQPHALLRRRLEFRKIGVSDVAGKVVGLAVGLGVALVGGSYWALVANVLVASSVRLLFVFRYSRITILPPQRGTGIAPMVRMGGWYVGFSFLNYIARHLDDILVGRFLGSAVLGIYARAYRLYLLPQSLVTGILGKVSLPVLSRMAGEDDRFTHAYLELVQVTVLTACTAGGWLAVLAPEVILIVLGDQWMEAVPVFRVFAIVGVFQPLHSTTAWIYTSLGRTDRMFRWEIVPAVLLSIGFVIGLRWGLMGMVYAYAAVWLGGLFLPGLWYALRLTTIGLGGLFQAILPHFGVMAVSTGGMLLARGILTSHDAGPLLTMLSTLAVGTILHILAALLLTRETMDRIRLLLSHPSGGTREG
ncbi:MAG: lipopolysaccharide biosynthesis protein [bacterium]